jgi:hypothetical protein
MFGPSAPWARVRAGIETGGVYERGPFGAVWSRGGAVQEIGSNVGDFVAERLEESHARTATEPSR